MISAQLRKPHPYSTTIQATVPFYKFNNDIGTPLLATVTKSSTWYNPERLAVRLAGRLGQRERAVTTTHKKN